MIGVRSQRGATSVVNSAMPTLTGTAMTSAIAEDDDRAERERERPERLRLTDPRRRS